MIQSVTIFVLFLPVEFPIADAGMETGTCSGYRQHRSDEGGRADTPHCALRGQPDQGGLSCPYRPK